MIHTRHAIRMAFMIVKEIYMKLTTRLVLMVMVCESVRHGESNYTGTVEPDY